jgi:DNA-binding IclR family transcriptional regulator
MERPAKLPADPAPALTRGLALLQTLAGGEGASLEQLASTAGWPKSSVLRLLASLERGGYVRRQAADKRYVATVQILPLAGSSADLLDRARAAMVDLCRQTGHTAELHQFDGRRLVMIDRREPAAAMVRVVARIGFQRDFTEFDALTQIVRAFGPPDLPMPRRSWAWKAGRRCTLDAHALDRVIASVRAEQVAADLGVNEHGVRRYAIPVLDDGQRLEAVLAVAQSYNPSRRGADPAILKTLRQALARN